MKCWRDLLHECSENDCPMWMEDFDLTDVAAEKTMGLDSSKCALALQEKLSVFQSMLDIAESVVTQSDFSDDELFRQIVESTMERSNQPPARTLKPAKPELAAKKQKKPMRS